VKIALFAATGKIGSKILIEAMNRHHIVTAVIRHPEKLTLKHPNLTVTKGNVLDEEEVAMIVKGHDVVVSAFGPGFANPADFPLFVKAAESLISGTKKAGVKRLINVGGAGSLYVTPGKQLVDTPEFPEAWRVAASYQRDSLEVFKKEKDLEWTFFCPAIFIEPGIRTGEFQIGKDEPVFNSKGESKISIEDYAMALVDEIEKPQFVRQRFTIGY
jgi:putative NADH-flavin reductase